MPQLLGMIDVLVAALVIAASLPLVLRKVPSNKWYGARFKASFASDQQWYDINVFSAKRMMSWSAVILAAGVVAIAGGVQESIWSALGLSLCPLLLIIPAIQSYRYAMCLDASAGTLL